MIRRLRIAAAIILFVIVGNIVYDPAPSEQPPASGGDCTFIPMQGLGWNDWDLVEVCEWLEV